MSKFGILSLFALILATADCRAVKVGDSETIVIKELGEPSGRMPMGPKTFNFLYPRGDVLIREGRVVRVNLTSKEDFEIARKREEEERKAAEARRLKEEAERVRRGEGGKTGASEPIQWHDYLELPSNSDVAHPLVITELGGNRSYFNATLRNNGKSPVRNIVILAKATCNCGCTSIVSKLVMRSRDGGDTIYPETSEYYHSSNFSELDITGTLKDPWKDEQTAHLNEHGVQVTLRILHYDKDLPVSGSMWITRGLNPTTSK